MTLSPRAIALEGITASAAPALVALRGFIGIEVVADRPTWSNPHPDFIRTHNIRVTRDTPATVSIHIATETDVPAFVSPHDHHVLRVVPAVDLSHLRR